MNLPRSCLYLLRTEIAHATSSVARRHARQEEGRGGTGPHVPDMTSARRLTVDLYLLVGGGGGDGDGGALRSFLSLDSEAGDGRVLRFDSLSKVLSSGVRVGWLSGAPAFVERVSLHQQVAALHSSGLSQAVVVALLEAWSHDGWEAHVLQVQAFYRRRRDAMEASARRHLAGLARWSAPEAGMFFWLDLSPSGCTDSLRLIMEECRDAKVLLVPGASFAVDTNATSSFVRAAFSTASEEEIDEGLARLAAVLRRSQQSSPF